MPNKEVSSRSLKEHAINLLFNDLDYTDLVIDTVNKSWCTVSEVYRAVNLDPAKSNMVKALTPKNAPKDENDKQKWHERVFQWLYMHLNGKSGQPNPCITRLDWSQFVDALPSDCRDPQSYLSYQVPNSLRTIAVEKLGPLEKQLLEDRGTLLQEEQPKKMDFRYHIRKNILEPLHSLVYLLFEGRLVHFEDRDSAEKTSSAYHKLRGKLMMEMADALTIQYFEDFFDKMSINYRLHIEHRMFTVNLFKGVDPLKVIRQYLH